MVITTRVARTGNSLCIRLSRRLAAEAGLAAGMMVAVWSPEAGRLQVNHVDEGALMRGALRTARKLRRKVEG